jgi:hypothetical protein
MKIVLEFKTEFKTLTEFAEFIIFANLTEFDIASQKLITTANIPVISFWNNISRVKIGRDKIYSVEKIVSTQYLLVAYKIVNRMLDKQSIQEDLICIDGLKKEVRGSNEVKKILSRKLPENFLLRLGPEIRSHDYIFRKIY